MCSRRVFSDMRRASMGVGVSKAKLSKAMLGILLQIPAGSTNLKETIVAHLGLIGQMTATRDINEAWNQAKKKAAKLYPEKFKRWIPMPTMAFADSCPITLYVAT